MADGNRKDTATFESATLAATKRRSVLIVDDEEVLVRAMTRVLEARGYQVTAAHDGNAAIGLIRRQPFDVIVSDIQMPGMTGIDLLRVVRAYDLDVPVILMTGAPTVETAIEAVSLGALQYLSKPTPGDELVKAVERASASAPHGDHEARGARSRRRRHPRWATARGSRRASTTPSRRCGSLSSRSWSPLAGESSATRRCCGPRSPRSRTRAPSSTRPSGSTDCPRSGGASARCAAMAFERAPPNSQLFINLHTRDLLDDTLYAKDAPLVEFADRVVLEITERSAIDDVKDIKARVIRAALARLPDRDRRPGRRLRGAVELRGARAGGGEARHVARAGTRTSPPSAGGSSLR